MCTSSTLASWESPPYLALPSLAHGGGISGAATAHFLSELVPDAQIDVYEAAPRVGGRAHTLDANIFGVPLDAGATSIFSKNKYLVSFVQKFHLNKASDDGKHVLGLWDGAAFRFRWPDSSLLPVHILARYGPSPLRLIQAVTSAVDRLLHVYELQAQNVSFPSPADLMDALKLTALTQSSAAAYFEKTLKVDSKFVDEFVTGASRDNCKHLQEPKTRACPLPPLTIEVFESRCGQITRAHGSTHSSTWSPSRGLGLAAPSSRSQTARRRSCVVEALLGSAPSSRTHTSSPVRTIRATGGANNAGRSVGRSAGRSMGQSAGHSAGHGAGLGSVCCAVEFCLLLGGVVCGCVKRVARVDTPVRVRARPCFNHTLSSSLLVVAGENLSLSMQEGIRPRRTPSA